MDSIKVIKYKSNPTEGRVAGMLNAWRVLKTLPDNDSI